MGQFNSTLESYNSKWESAPFEAKEIRQAEQWVQMTENRLQKEDVLTYHRLWVELFGINGKMDVEGFKKWIKAIDAFPNYNPDKSPVDHLFRSYDINRKGEISFEEFLLYVSITSPSNGEVSTDKLIDVTFSMYDENYSNAATKEQFTKCMSATFQLLGYNPNEEPFNKEIEKRVKYLFKAVRHAHPNLITLTELKQSVKDNPEILKIL